MLAKVDFALEKKLALMLAMDVPRSVILEKLGLLELDISQKLNTWFSENPESAVQNVITSLENIEKEFEARNNIFIKK